MRELSTMVAALAATFIGCGDDDEQFGYRRGLPFAEPSEIGSVGGVTSAQLLSKEADVDISGASVRGTVYNDAFVGPTLRVAPGETLRVTLQNQLMQHTNIHYHGLHVSPSGNSDNIFLMVLPGETFEYELRIPADHDPGTFWYHSHMHMDSEGQVFGGLSGVLIVEGLEQRLPAAYRGITQHVFALKDLQVKDGAIVASNIDSNAPTVRTVNGLVAPRLTLRPGETQLWRLANISADIFYDVTFATQPLLVIAEDGNPVEKLWTAMDLVLPPGKRFDVIVSAPTTVGSYALKTLAYDQGGDSYPEDTLVTVDVAGEAAAALPALTQGLAPEAGLSAASAVVAQTREFTFSEDASGNTFFINGMQFDMNRVDAAPKLGTIEEWTIRNSSSEQHPFHIHVNDFKVLSIDGVPYQANGEQDTVVLPPGGAAVIRMAFLDFVGKFVFHCHILAHEDGGMMVVVEVVP